MPLQRAVFLDRDGTINEESGYLFRKEDCRFIPGALSAISELHKAGFLIIVVTNQSGIARGLYNEVDLEKLHTFMNEEIEAAGGKVVSWYHCPHHPDYPGDATQCDCRKPLPGMLHRAARELAIDLGASWMVGDKLADINAGLAAGCQTILVKTGYGAEAAAASPPGVVVLPDLRAAAAHIIDSES